VAALPRILQTLKARGYRIVHVVPATADRPKTPTEPREWFIHPPSASVAMAHWPRVPKFLFVSTETLPGPALSDSDLHGGKLLAPQGPGNTAGPLQTASPFHAALNTANNQLALPVPSESIFARPEKAVATSYGVSPVLIPVSHRPSPVASRPRGGSHAIRAENGTRLIPGSQPITQPSLLAPSAVLQR
jgi:hypothetical protein